MRKLEKQGKTPDLKILDRIYQIRFGNYVIKKKENRTEKKLMKGLFILKFST